MLDAWHRDLPGPKMIGPEDDGRILGPSIAEDAVPDAIATLIEIFRTNRKAGESFAVSLARLGAEPFKEALHGRS